MKLNPREKIRRSRNKIHKKIYPVLKHHLFLRKTIILRNRPKETILLIRFHDYVIGWIQEITNVEKQSSNNNNKRDNEISTQLQISCVGCTKIEDATGDFSMLVSDNGDKKQVDLLLSTIKTFNGSIGFFKD